MLRFEDGQAEIVWLLDLGNLTETTQAAGWMSSRLESLIRVTFGNGSGEGHDTGGVGEIGSARPLRIEVEQL